MSSPSMSELFRVFGRIGFMSFGGPAAQIALMHKELVEDRPWLSERQFLSALSFCMLLPGPEAMQLATYAGWLKRGTLGGVMAGALFVLPGAAVILALALAYAQFGTLPLVQAAFLGVQATVVVIVLMALQKIANKALSNTVSRTLALLSFVAIFALNTPFPLVVLGAALIGALRPDTASAESGTPPRHRFNWRAVLTCIILWALPFAALLIWPAPFLWDVAQFFSKLAVVTFGGAYAVLAYMTQAVVQDFNWLNLNQMMDALGLAETTPGPLILVTQFVATLAGQLQGGISAALIAGALTLWVTFIPCFLWIFAAAPYVERITHAPRLAGALSAITAAVAGVIANLSIWFAMQLLFGEVTQTAFAPLPVWSTLSPLAAMFIGLAAILMLVLKRSMLVTLAIMAGIGLGWGAIGV
ncbi:chromate efflux transporter [Thalassobius sp. Cn5-15]|uniref:chromate efflux transporter n=1 Tax=Thalassobius sp. Cn5-15 TaxID=2917763 RepID=UPI001EF370A1|nr:chromate efflux transporter [Thalassobius sp. Cn5-15]MCG7492656.1 chromate efflux transporter [Thalassobius sp. Cn5-15]